MDYILRYAEKKVKEYSEFFKVVAVIGARQVGKSTMLSKIYADMPHITFDPVQDIYGARRDPDLFLKNFKPPMILDEIQYVPELMPALKRFVDIDGSPGQYFITGSQNLTVLKTISESLAGRVGIINLFSMSGAEISRVPINTESWIKKLINGTMDADKVFFFGEDKETLTHFLWKGTMPGVVSAKDEMIFPYFESYVTTYIERDVRNAEDIKNISDFSRFVRVCSSLTAQEINSSHLGREVGITPQTASRWLDLLRLSFQWFELDPYFGNTIKRISGKRKGYLFDTGLICYLQRIASPKALMASPNFGAIFETSCVNSIVKTISSFDVKPVLYHWRTAGGAEVDVVMEYDEKLFPVEMKAKTNLSGHDTRGITAFFETYPSKADVGVIIYAGDRIYKVKDNIWAVPWNAV